MSLKMFTVHDSKAEAFIQPFFSQSTGTAIREFAAACNEQDHQFHKYAGDYTLFELGEFDQETAKFNLASSPLNLGLAITFIDTNDYTKAAKSEAFLRSINDTTGAK